VSKSTNYLLAGDDAGSKLGKFPEVEHHDHRRGDPCEQFASGDDH